MTWFSVSPHKTSSLYPSKCFLMNGLYFFRIVLGIQKNWTASTKTPYYLISSLSHTISRFWVFFSDTYLSTLEALFQVWSTTNYVENKAGEESKAAPKFLACVTMWVVQSFIHIGVQEKEQNREEDASSLWHIVWCICEIPVETGSWDTWPGITELQSKSS